MIECYQWRLWLVPKCRNGLIYTQYHCCRSFPYFWTKSARQQQPAEYNNFYSISDNRADHVRLIWSNGTSERFDWFLMLDMDSFTLNTTTAYHFAIFDGSVATTQLSAASLHLSVLNHKNWRSPSSVVDPDDYQVAKLYLEYWWTADSARLHFDLSWFFHHLLAT